MFAASRQVQRLLCSLVKQADDSWKFGPDTGSAVTAGKKHEENSAVNGNDETLFMDALWNQALWPHLSVALSSRGVFLVTDVFQAARRLAQKNLENEVCSAFAISCSMEESHGKTLPGLASEKAVDGRIP